MKTNFGGERKRSRIIEDAFTIFGCRNYCGLKRMGEKEE